MPVRAPTTASKHHAGWLLVMDAPWRVHLDRHGPHLVTRPADGGKVRDVQSALGSRPVAALRAREGGAPRAAGGGTG